MASGGADQLALFNQYDNEYCTKATDVARKIEAVSSLTGGKLSSRSGHLHRLYVSLFTSWDFHMRTL